MHLKMVIVAIPLFIAICVIRANAQKTFKFFFDKNWETCKEKDAEFYRIINLDANGKPIGLVKDFYKSGAIQWEGNFIYFDTKNPGNDSIEGNSISYWPNGQRQNEGLRIQNKKEGLWTSWFEDGKVNSTQNYKNGLLDGQSIEYFKDGKQKQITDYIGGKVHGNLITYWPNGVMKRKDINQDGEMKSGSCWDSTGANIPYFPYWIDPQFPGGEDLMNNFISSQIKYPEKYRRRYREGYVIVSFSVAKSGKIEKVHMLKPDKELFNQEALRVIQNMPAWSPGKVDGEPVETKINIPIRFKLI